MSSDEGDEDKQHDPSQKKLDDARNKGEIAKSADLTTAAGYLGLLVVAFVVGSQTLTATAAILVALLEAAPELSNDIFYGSGTQIMLGFAKSISFTLMPWVVAPFTFACLMLFLQKGWVFAPSKLAMKFSRISIIKGFKNKFGKSGLFEFFKNFVKLALYSTALGFFIWNQLPRILSTITMPPRLISTELSKLCMTLFLIVVLISLAIGIIDFIFQKFDHNRKNRMSRQELIEEQKQAEGDPLMKQQRRQKAVSIAMNQMLINVPEADVVLVNPTHYAIALKWDPGTGRAPVCVAKGVDEIAYRIRKVAIESNVAIHHDPPTARELYATVELGEQVLPKHYRAVAAAIRFAEGLRNKTTSVSA